MAAYLASTAFTMSKSFHILALNCFEPCRPSFVVERRRGFPLQSCLHNELESLKIGRFYSCILVGNFVVKVCIGLFWDALVRVHLMAAMPHYEQAGRFILASNIRLSSFTHLYHHDIVHSK